MAWTIVSEQNAQLSAILKAKYYSNASFWTAPLHTPRSLFWASILKIKNELHDQTFFQIAKGNTNIWSQPWAPTWQDMHSRLQEHIPRSSIPNIVSDMWIPTTKTWDTNKIQLFFGSDAVQEFTQIPILKCQHDDFLCWKSSTSGDCTAKDAYITLANQNQTPIPTQGSRGLPQPVLRLLNSIWKHSHLQPRLKAFAWRLLRQALATGQRAARFSNNIDGKCSRCGTIESDNHLFFSCDFARAVWFAGSPSIRADLLQEGRQELTYLINTSTSV
ncbi:unnamed protein product [Urochloa humidicola]